MSDQKSESERISNTSSKSKSSKEAEGDEDKEKEEKKSNDSDEDVTALEGIAATVDELLEEDEAAVLVTGGGDNDKIEDSKAWEAEEGAEDLEVVDDVDSDTGGERIYAKEYVRAFKPFIYFARACGRFPYSFHRTDTGIVTFFLGGLYNTVFKFTCGFHFVLLFVTLVNLFGLLLNIPRIPDSPGASFHLFKSPKGVTGTGTWTIRAEELYIFHRNVPSLISFLTGLIHVCIADYHMLVRGKFLSVYFTFWTEALQMTKLHAAVGVFSYMLIVIIIECMLNVYFCALVALRFAPVTSGAPGLIAVLLVRVMDQTAYASGNYKYLKMFSSFMLGYVLIVSKFYVYLFIFKGKLIRNAFRAWNDRLDTVLNRSDDYIVRGNRLGRRTGFRELFQDHVVLLELLEGNDVLFSEIIESFFTCFVGSYCFQVYSVYRSITGNEKDVGEFAGARELDKFMGGGYLLDSTILFALIFVTISSLSEETMEGLEILRRKGFFGRKSPEELYFLLSLYTSYNGHFETAISGAGYYVMNKEFLLALAGTFLVYIVILLQFSPPLLLADVDLLKQITGGNESGTKVLIKTIEDTYQWLEEYKVGYFKMERQFVDNQDGVNNYSLTNLDF